MLRVYIVVLATLVCGLKGHCQLKKFYTVKDEASFDTVAFSLKATSGTCFINPADNNDPVTIYGNPSFSEVNPTFHTEIKNNRNQVNLFLEDYNQKGLSQAISYSMFGNEKSEKNFWKIFLADQKVYDLDLKYGVGDAYVNLSDLPVSKFKIESGSANVKIMYDDNSMNKCVMDTFSVNVDVGNLMTKNVNKSKAKVVIADVGFGTAVLDFSEGVTEYCKVNVSVGAGKLKIIVPENDYPAIIYFKSSPLCNLSLSQSFEEVSENVYVNRSYSASAKNLMEFNVDVALGNIIFEYVK
ncbi:hypothetical protein SAMN04488029_2391 [Reichenbachiella faecimaris]|uniref:N-terminal domain of toast_rack, DUF2154 n=1 Tax=Reichenbachiella faecimaris TaxID=692418 RepID=A0A1W2GFC8_REIFA|nr:hypothetical protein [Reichenbachiella faecimaris]SMD35192.1 hypothetical protein SAMN04488029_2391 [Reichenbachiella faecimaris]